MNQRIEGVLIPRDPKILYVRERYERGKVVSVKYGLSEGTRDYDSIGDLAKAINESFNRILYAFNESKESLCLFCDPVKNVEHTRRFNGSEMEELAKRLSELE